MFFVLHIVHFFCGFQVIDVWVPKWTGQPVQSAKKLLGKNWDILWKQLGLPKTRQSYIKHSLEMWITSIRLNNYHCPLFLVKMSPFKTLLTMKQSGINHVIKSSVVTDWAELQEKGIRMKLAALRLTPFQVESNIEILHPSKRNCLFCTKEEGHLHEFSTLGSDTNIRHMATKLQDSPLLARIARCDLIALETKYHMPCLTSFRNRHHSFLQKQRCTDSLDKEEGRAKGRAVIDLFTYMENTIRDGVFFFISADLWNMYINCLEALGIHDGINKNRFKQMILEHFPGAKEHQQGKHVVFFLEESMHDLLKQGLTPSFDKDASTLAKASSIVHRDIF